MVRPKQANPARIDDTSRRFRRSSGERDSNWLDSQPKTRNSTMSVIKMEKCSAFKSVGSFNYPQGLGLGLGLASLVAELSDSSRHRTISSNSSTVSSSCQSDECCSSDLKLEPKMEEGDFSSNEALPETSRYHRRTSSNCKSDGGPADEKPKIECGVCGMLFRFPSKLKRHEKIHDVDHPKEYPCDLCPKAFRYAYHLRRHKWLIHAPDRPVFTCDICLKSYKGEELFRLHRSMAHLPPVVTNTFNSSNNFANHLNNQEPTQSEDDEDVIIDIDSPPTPPPPPPSSHGLVAVSQPKEQTTTITMVNAVGDKIFNCHICGTNFKQKHYLTQHLMTHSKERPFVCEICQKGFARASTLFAHRYVHTVGRHFQCGTCKKAFKHKRSLTEHIKAKVCFPFNDSRPANFGGSLSSSSSPPLVEEIGTSNNNNNNNTTGRSQSSGGQYFCEFCGDFFASVSYLYMHRRRSHRDKFRSGTQQQSPAFGGSRDANSNQSIKVSVLKTIGSPDAEKMAIPIVVAGTCFMEPSFHS